MSRRDKLNLKVGLQRRLKFCTEVNGIYKFLYIGTCILRPQLNRINSAFYLDTDLSFMTKFTGCINSSPVAHKPLEIATVYLNFQLVAQIGYWKMKLYIFSDLFITPKVKVLSCYAQVFTHLIILINLNLGHPTLILAT